MRSKKASNRIDGERSRIRFVPPLLAILGRSIKFYHCCSHNPASKFLVAKSRFTRAPNETSSKAWYGSMSKTKCKVSVRLYASKPMIERYCVSVYNNLVLAKNQPSLIWRYFLRFLFLPSLLMLSTKALPLGRCFSATATSFAKVNTVAIVGAGLMGSGIAQITAAAKLNVSLVDQSDEILEKARKTIDTNLRRVAKKKHAEDKTKNIDVKSKTFSEIEKKLAKPSAILTTNTSSFRLADIAVNLKSKSQFGGLHFFNPVPVMKLLEIVRHDETSKETFETLMEYGKDIGKKTVACKVSLRFIRT
ncbi:3-hydroxyacyl-CoA dehydrogenase, NAD binding domain protein [Cooperia oncophora]